MLGICSVIVRSVSRLSFSLILLRRGGKDYSIHCVRFKSVIVRKIEIYKKDIRKESSGIVSRVANPSRV